MHDHWTLSLEANEQHCLRLSHPKTGVLRCWHGQQTYAMLGSPDARELLSLECLLAGRPYQLCKSEVCELLLLAARTAVELDNHARVIGDAQTSSAGPQ